MPTIPDDLRRRLHEHGQEHVLEGWHELTEADQRVALQQLAALNLNELRELYERRNETYPLPSSEQIKPAPIIQRNAADEGAAQQTGEEALRRGEVAALVVAGGQGSRLG